MSRHATTIHLTPDERAALERRVRARTSPQQAVLRAQIILRAAAGARNEDIAAALGIARHTVQRWRDRFAATRLPGLADRPHQPPPRRYGPERQAQIVLLACQSPTSLGWAGQTH
jgi:transposase